MTRGRQCADRLKHLHLSTTQSRSHGITCTETCDTHCVGNPGSYHINKSHSQRSPRNRKCIFPAASRINLLTGVQKTKNILDTTHSSPVASVNTYGVIKNKVALITDRQYTQQLMPLILHYHSVLGPDWPIVFHTSNDTFTKHFSPETAANPSAIWQRAVSDRRIDVRVLPPGADFSRRNTVNLFLSPPWLWEQLAPAQNVLIFQDLKSHSFFRTTKGVTDSL